MSRHIGQTSSNETKMIVSIGLVLVIVVVTMILFSTNSNTNTSSNSTTSLHVGDTAPPFLLPARGGATASLDQYQNKPVLLYFNEGVGCSSCWQQIITLEHDPQFSSAGVPLVTITPDSSDLWDNIVKANPIKSPILTDADLTVARQYGMLSMPSSMHGGMRPGHTFVLLDRSHKVIWIGDYPQMNVSARELAEVIKDKL